MLEQNQFLVEKQDDICKIQVLPHIASAPLTLKFKDTIDEVLEKHKFKKIIFDLSKVEFVDSSFIGAIVYAYKNLDKLNGKICCVIKSATVNDRFLIPQLDKLFKIFPNMEDAIQYMKSI
ncbi:MAG: STAS domain-containing protein [Ignavibacteria bacterium]|nr:STAS domain-containing protein [Ignavibacteria bacterium]